MAFCRSRRFTKGIHFHNMFLALLHQKITVISDKQVIVHVEMLRKVIFDTFPRIIGFFIRSRCSMNDLVIEEVKKTFREALPMYPCSENREF